MEIRVLFYTAEGRLIDKIIRWFTGSKYSHCEILFPSGKMFSSDAWGGGVRYTKQYTLQNWDIVPIRITAEEHKTLVDWCDWKIGSPYDWTGALAFAIPFLEQSTDKWFCSELCGEALRLIGKVPTTSIAHKLTPQGLYNLLINGK